MDTGEKNVLGPFWGLASNDSLKQLHSAKELVVLLRSSQDEHELNSNSGLCDNLLYSVERLVRGLSSNRDGARQGFAICLTELLSLFDCVSVDEILQLVDKHLVATGSAKAQEERGVYFGQVCALLAIVQSGRIHSVPLETISDLLKRLQLLANKKLYLREVSMVGTVQLIREVGSRLSFDEHIWPLFKPLIVGGWEKCTPNTVYLLLALLEIYSKNETLKKVVKDKWTHKQLLHPDNFEHLATVLKESTFAHPNVHSVWPIVLDAVRKKGHLTPFWKIIVDESLILSSHERKYLSFKLLELLLPTLDVSEVVAVFTPNLLRCLRNNLSGTDNYLNKAAKLLVKCIGTTIGSSTDKSIQVAFLLQLQAQSYGKDFDSITKSSLVGDITNQLDSDGVLLYVEHLWNKFVCCTSSEEDVDAQRQRLLDQILSLFRNSKLKQLSPDQWMVYLLKMIFQQAFFSVVKVPKKSALQLKLELQVAAPPISSDSTQLLQQRFVSMLVDLSNVQPHIQTGDTRTSRGLPGTDHNGEHLVRQLVDYAYGLLNASSSYVIPIVQQTTEIHSSWKQMMETLGRDKTDTPKSMTSHALQLLMCHAGLQLFYDQSGGLELLKELLTIHDKVLGVSEVKEDEPHWTEVLTDVLLGFLAQPSQLWRTLSKQTYRHITPHLTEEALHLVIKVVDPQYKEDLHSYLQLVDDEQEDDMLSVDEEEEEDHDSAGSDEDSDDASVEEDEVESDDMECEVDEEFRKEIKLALGDAALPTSESEDDNINDFDDEAMMRVDNALAAAFRARKKSSTSKKDRKDFQHQLMDFRLRVLDLIEIYIRWQSRTIQSLDLVLPLFRLIMSCSNDTLPLANRATTIFTKKLCHMKEYPRITVADQAHVYDLLKQLLQAAYKVPTAGQELITQGSMFLLRVLRGGKRESSEQTVHKKKRRHSDIPDVNFGLIDLTTVVPLFSDLLTDFLTNKNSNVHHMLFMALVERYPDLGWYLSKGLAGHLPKAVNQFRMGQACEIMTSLLHQPVQLPEASSECLSSISKDVKCFCIEHLRCDGQKKAKHIKPIVKLLYQLILSCKQQSDVFTGCFDCEGLLTEINELIEEDDSNHNSILVANECRKLITLLTEVDDGSKRHKAKKRRRK